MVDCWTRRSGWPGDGSTARLGGRIDSAAWVVGSTARPSGRAGRLDDATARPGWSDRPRGRRAGPGGSTTRPRGLGGRIDHATARPGDGSTTRPSGRTLLTAGRTPLVANPAERSDAKLHPDAVAHVDVVAKQGEHLVLRGRADDGDGGRDVRERAGLDDRPGSLQALEPRDVLRPERSARLRPIRGVGRLHVPGDFDRRRSRIGHPAVPPVISVIATRARATPAACERVIRSRRMAAARRTVTTG